MKIFYATPLIATAISYLIVTPFFQPSSKPVAMVKASPVIAIPELETEPEVEPQDNIQPIPEEVSRNSDRLDLIESKIDQLLAFSSENLSETKKISSSISNLESSNHSNAMLIVEAINSLKTPSDSSPVASEVVPIQEDEPKTKIVKRKRTEWRQVCRGGFCEMVPYEVEYEIEVPIDATEAEINEIIPIPEDGSPAPPPGQPGDDVCGCGCGLAGCNCQASSGSRRFGSKIVQGLANMRGRWLNFRSRLLNRRINSFNARWR